jgi:hypothetical protein
MKTRLSFVANSSSSSFVVFCREIEDEEFVKIEKASSLWGLGKELGDGDDFFELDEGMFEFLKDKVIKLEKKEEYVPIRFYEVYGWVCNENEINLEQLKKEITNLPEKFDVKEIKKDWCSSDSLYDIKENYFPKEKRG